MQVVDPSTVQVVLNTPVTDFPSYLFATGRLGIMAPAQLNAGEDCATKLIGSGPFILSEYEQNEQTVVTKNPDYWATDAAGEPLTTRLIRIEATLVQSASLEGRTARIAVSFVADSASVIRDKDGSLGGILVHDEQVKDQPVTWMAEQGRLFRGDDGPILVLESGNRQELTQDDAGRPNLAILHFDSYAHDLAATASPRSFSSLSASSASCPEDARTTRWPSP